MISQRARYALKALFRLCQNAGDEPLQIRDIAVADSIPQPFLEQILLELKRAGLVVSRRGKAGGYRIAKPPSEMNLAAVLRVIDGPVAPLPCLSRTAYRRCADCADEGACALRKLFARTYDAMLAELEKATLADLVEAGGDLPDAAVAAE
ncbi:Rrf2 family transcriptional regulator [Alsobacter sp. SYSU M60028]|uniref:Rrf2 family transcriptional regulator n=1 Tax=Alsobacter ponti TaxID=2962936 RepID=A0ABT1LFP3_9HYPH|nr:Rrf2 family transcriptional regulator [Alsobacter ponti]MCP8939771.1 Rrf2 family transcriptional regulator [Alsobacter ponti]